MAQAKSDGHARADRAQQALDNIQLGHAQLAGLAACEQGLGDAGGIGAGAWPLQRLATAYRAAFDALAGVCLGVPSQGSGEDTIEAAQFLEFVQRAAEALLRAVDLIFAQRGLGSVSDTCAYVARLENKSDALFHRCVARAMSQGRTQEPNAAPATIFEALETLEGIMDRCEEIAEALLLVYWIQAHAGSSAT